MKKEFKFKVNAVPTLLPPYKNREYTDLKIEAVYYLLVNINDLSSDLPLDVNPSVPKMGTNVAKRLINAVIEPETDFYLNNRGIVISAKEFSFDSKNSEVWINLGNTDDEYDMFNYGILDGGYTYTAIIVLLLSKIETECPEILKSILGLKLLQMLLI